MVIINGIIKNRNKKNKKNKNKKMNLISSRKSESLGVNGMTTNNIRYQDERVVLAARQEQLTKLTSKLSEK